MLRDSVIGKPIWKQTGSSIPHTTPTISATAHFAFSQATSTKATPLTSVSPTSEGIPISGIVEMDNVATT